MCSDALVHLLKVCPDIVSVRKELLIAMRTVIANALNKDILRPKLDLFLEDERLLVGSGRACNETQWSTGCTVLAELVYTFRKTLNMQQLQVGSDEGRGCGRCGVG